jgi:hypothetical protein
MAVLPFGVVLVVARSNRLMIYSPSFNDVLAALKRIQPGWLEQLMPNGDLQPTAPGENSEPPRLKLDVAADK